MNLLRFCEIALYVFVDLIPNLILALLPFKNNLRVSKRMCFLLTFIIYAFVTLSRIIPLYYSRASAILSVLWIALYLGFYMLVIKAPVSKLLFVLLNIINYGSFISIIFSHISNYHFSGSTNYAYSFNSTAILTLTLLFSYPFLYYIMSHQMYKLVSSTDNNRYWKSLWLVPATFCLSYYYNLFTNGGIINFSSEINNVLFAAFFNAGGIFVNFIIMRLLIDNNETMRLKAENYQLNMQTVQYENLTNRMDDARQARHDLRQTLAVIQSGLKQKNYENVIEYLQSYAETLPSESPIVYCENYAANALLVYYADMAKKHGISYSAKVQYDPPFDIADADFVVLMGNLLENAIEACLRQSHGSPFISLNIKCDCGMLVILLDNSYEHVITKKNGRFISSKTGREGIGTASAYKIIKKYNGISEYKCENGKFSVSIMLNQTKKEK